MSTPKPPLSSGNLKQQRDEVEARLEALRQEQVDALEQGSDFKHNNEILIINEQLAALDKAIARAIHREAEEDARRARSEQCDAARRQQDVLKEAEKAYLNVLADAERAAAELVSLLQTVDARSSDMYQAGIAARDFLRRHDQPADEPNELSGPNLDTRLSGYLSSTLCGLRPKSHSSSRLGGVSWQSVRVMDTSWADAEKRALAGNQNQKLRALDRVVAALQESRSNEDQ